MVVDITEGDLLEIKTSLRDLSAAVNGLALSNASLQSEVAALKEQLLDKVQSNGSALAEQSRKHDDLSKYAHELGAAVKALESRQAPLTTPAAWGALIISGIIAAKSFFGM